MLAALFRDPGLKLLSLLMAVLAWAWVQGQQTTTERLRVDLQFELSPNHVSSDPLQTTATVVVDGTLAAIRRAQILRPSLRIDLSDEKTGTHEVPLAEGTLDGLPAGLTVSGWVPEAVRVRLEPRARRSVPIEVQWAGVPALEVTVGKARPYPEVVEVWGPKAAVQELDSVKTKPVDVTGWDATREVDVQLDLPRGVDVVEPWAGKATIEVDSATSVVTLTGVQVVVLGRGDWRPAPGSEFIEVRLQGPSRILRTIRPDRIAALVELPVEPAGTSVEAAFQATKAPRYDLVFPREDVVRIVEPPPPVTIIRR